MQVAKMLTKIYNQNVYALRIPPHLILILISQKSTQRLQKISIEL